MQHYLQVVLVVQVHGWQRARLDVLQFDEQTVERRERIRVAFVRHWLLISGAGGELLLLYFVKRQVFELLLLLLSRLVVGGVELRDGHVQRRLGIVERLLHEAATQLVQLVYGFDLRRLRLLHVVLCVRVRFLVGT